jgi:hypothetical protein
MKNAGNTETTISEEKSLKKLVSPRKKTLRGNQNSVFHLCHSITDEETQESYDDIVLL